jgi:aspartate-semialdehyde dehydrogenase
MKKEKYNVAVVGATGVVGQEMIKILEERQFPVDKLTFLASTRSAGEVVECFGKEITVEELKEDSFEGIDVALFSAGGDISSKFAPCAVDSGAVVIDNTSVFRMDPEVPLVVPEVNPKDTAGYKTKGIIANPNCSTIQLVVALKPIHDKYNIRRVVVSTYQSVSGAGKEAIEELSSQVRALFSQQECEKKVFPYRIAFNCIPHIDVFLEDGYTKEEMKVVNETKKILGDEKIKVTATAVRVPVFFSHSESVNLELTKAFELDEIRKLLKESPGILLVDDPANLKYPLATEAAAQDPTCVGRIRRDTTVDNGLNMWVVADNLRKGAALNAVQIGEILIRDYL